MTPSRRGPTSTSQETAERMLAAAGLTPVDDPAEASPPTLTAVRAPAELELAFYAEAEADDGLTDVYLDPFEALLLPGELGSKEDLIELDDEPATAPIPRAAVRLAPDLEQQPAPTTRRAAPVESAAWPAGEPTNASRHGFSEPTAASWIDEPDKLDVRSVAPTQLNEPPVRKAPHPWERGRTRRPRRAPLLGPDKASRPVERPAMRAGRQGAMVERLREQQVPAWMAAAVIAAVALILAITLIGDDSPHARAAARTTATLPASLLALTQQPQLPASTRPAPRRKATSAAKSTQRHRARRWRVKRATHRTARHVNVARAAAVPAAAPVPRPVVAALRVAPVVRRAVVPAPAVRVLPRGESSAWSGDFRP